MIIPHSHKPYTFYWKCGKARLEAEANYSAVAPTSSICVLLPQPTNPAGNCAEKFTARFLMLDLAFSPH